VFPLKLTGKWGGEGGSQTNMITSKNVKHFNAQNKGNPDRKGRGNTQASALWGKHCASVDNPMDMCGFRGLGDPPVFDFCCPLEKCSRSVTKVCKTTHVFPLFCHATNLYPTNDFPEEMLLERRLHSGQSEWLLGLPAV